MVLTVLRRGQQHRISPAGRGANASLFWRITCRNSKTGGRVYVDNCRAMAEATAHLIALGHQHIVMAAGPMLQSDRACCCDYTVICEQDLSEVRTL
ncbi:hypothetical protein WDV93_00840 [Pantoea ananatis]